MSFIKDENGQGMLEYVLIIATVSYTHLQGFQTEKLLLCLVKPKKKLKHKFAFMKKRELLKAIVP